MSRLTGDGGVGAASASVSREQFEQQLEDAGARVDSVTTYRTCSDGAKLTELRTLLIGGAPDIFAKKEADRARKTPSNVRFV